jgi:hypothetical protein
MNNALERAMAVFFGVVKGNRVELEGDAQLKAGARVEVRPVAPEGIDSGATDLAEAERALTRDLLASGLLDHAPADEPDSYEPFEPVTVWGRLLSKQIIADRR